MKYLVSPTTISIMILLKMFEKSRSLLFRAARRANQERLTSVRVKMLLLVWHLVEFLQTALHGTQKRFFFRVNAKMVKKVVPFSEELAAKWMVAGEYAWQAACLWINELDLTEVSRVWHVHNLVVESGQVCCLPWYGEHLHVWFKIKGGHYSSLIWRAGVRETKSWIFYLHRRGCACLKD